MTDAPSPRPSTRDAFTIERMRRDVAGVLDVDPVEILDTDNLVDHGLDSIRLMLLLQRWHDAGGAVTFDALASRPELRHWARLLQPPDDPAR